jgi:Flp pilus assembly protein TadD
MTESSLARVLLEAEGYLELGMFEESAQALAGLPPGVQSQREVMALKVALHMTAKNWAVAAEIAACLVEREPEEAGWWVNLAYCVRRARSLDEAEAVLLRAVVLHASHAIIHYNLACYACVGGRLELAKERLSQALRLDKGVEEMARHDGDLAALRDWIGAGC